jgi:Zn-dependent peptidase ImmA (M78 family)/DNA-binding XRE family transcriptional regulator
MDEKNLLQLEPIDPHLLGQRLEEARKARGVTQQEAADHLGCSRPTYIAIEKGERAAKSDETVKLAAFYGRSVHELVRPGEPVADLQPHLRAAIEKMKPATEKELLQAIAELQRLAADYHELERLMNAPLRFNYPPEIKLADRFDVKDQAEDVAIRERQRLGLGDQPISNLRSTLEWDVGLRIFYWALPSAVAGMYAFVADLGCCILINRKHPPERRRASMLHEYGHLIVDRFKPGIDYLTYAGRKPANERFAEVFAMSFLMPATSIRRRFQEIVTTTNDFQVADLCRLSNFYFVSVEAMTLRLEGLGLIPKGSWSHIKESRLEVRKATNLLELPAHRETKDAFPDRYKFLAVHAYEKEKITEGQLARFLRCDPVTAREIVAQCLTSRMVEEDGEERNLQLEFQNSLLSNAP